MADYPRARSATSVLVRGQRVYPSNTGYSAPAEQQQDSLSGPLGRECSATIWMGRQRQSGWPFWRSRRGDDCRGGTITQALFGERWFDCGGATITMIP